MENELALKVAGAVILLLLTIISYFAKRTLEKTELTYTNVLELKSLHTIDKQTHDRDIEEINCNLVNIESQIKNIDENFSKHLREYHNEKG